MKHDVFPFYHTILKKYLTLYNVIRKMNPFDSSEDYDAHPPHISEYSPMSTIKFNAELTVNQALAIMTLLPRCYSLQVDREVKEKRERKRKEQSMPTRTDFPARVRKQNPYRDDRELLIYYPSSYDHLNFGVMSS